MITYLSDLLFSNSSIGVLVHPARVRACQISNKLMFVCSAQKRKGEHTRRVELVRKEKESSFIRDEIDSCL